MSTIRNVMPSERGILFEVDRPGERAIDVLVDGRRVWSFTEPAEPAPAELLAGGGDVGAGRVLFTPWPAALRRRLDGRFLLELRPVGEVVGCTATAELGDRGGPPDLADVYGRPLVVNKWGRLGHTLADAGPGLVERLLDSTDAIRSLLEQRLGPVVMVTGGTLLGPVRAGGRLIPHDDDADLAYVSRWTHPADVARESYELGRLLREHGYEVIRLTAAHVQVHVWHDGVPDHYVDVFAGFFLDGVYHQHFAIRAPLRPDQLLPTSTVAVEGRPEPAPRDPEAVLDVNYGTGWRVPDPAFAFDLPESTTGRFAAWFGDYLAERETWEDLVLLGLARPTERDEASPLAEEAHAAAPPEHRLLDLGCGLGADARALAARGRTVLGVDFSRYAVRLARAAPSQGSGSAEFDVVNLLDVRQVLRLAARCAAETGPWTVYGRRLLNALDPPARDNVFRLCGMLLRRGGSAFFDVVTDPACTAIPPWLRLPVAQLAEEAAAHGLVLEPTGTRVEQFSWIQAPEEEPVEMTRVLVRWRNG